MPLVKGLADADGGFHHFLLVDISPDADKAKLRVEVVRFHGILIAGSTGDGIWREVENQIRT